MVLALDTAQDACSVAVLHGTDVLASASEPMQRGHQERLAPMAAEAMMRAEIGFDRLNRVGVTVGPGSFTGLRVGLAFAKGLSLALDVPCVGVGTLEALAAGLDGFVVSVIDAKRDQVYLQCFQDGEALTQPDVLDVELAGEQARSYRSDAAPMLVGSGRALLAPALPDAVCSSRAAVDIVALARLSQTKPLPMERPRPLYLRAPEAKTIAERAAERA